MNSFGQRLLAIGFCIWVFLAPAHMAIISVAGLPIVDLIMALLCARKALGPFQFNPLREVITWLGLITSGGLKRTVAKILIYEAATLLAFMVGTYLVGPSLPVLQGVTALIGITELKSCLEHLDELNGSPFFASIINTLAPPGTPKGD